MTGGQGNKRPPTVDVRPADDALSGQSARRFRSRIAKRNVTRGGRRVCGSLNTILSREIWSPAADRIAYTSARSNERSSIRENRLD